MNQQSLIKLAFRQALSGWHQAEWRALLLSLLLVVASATLMALLSNQVERGLSQQSAEMLGADLILTSSRPTDPQWITQADQLGLTKNQTIRLTTMAAAGEQFLLSTVRAVTPSYPLRGSIKLLPEQATSIPQAGTLWAEPALLERLKLSIGDSLTLGYKTFTLSSVIQSSPDRGSGFTSFNPQLIINQQDLEETGLIGPGARVRYQLMLTGEKDALKKLTESARSSNSPGLRVIAVTDQENLSSSALASSSGYLRLGAVLTLLLCALTLALSQRRYIEKNRKRAALLLTLGMTPKQVVQLFIWQWTIALLATSIAGTLLTLLLQQSALAMLSPLLPAGLPSPALILWLTGPALALLMLAGFGLPPLLSIHQVQAAQLFQNNFSGTNQNGRLVIALTGVLLITLFYLYLESLSLAITLIAAFALTGWATGRLGTVLMEKVAKALSTKVDLGRLLALRVRQQRRWYRIQIPVMTLLLTLATLTMIARFDLVSRWQSQLPKEMPDHFLVNIQPTEHNPVMQILQQQGISTQAYPMVKGRLNSKNDLPPEEAFTEQQRQHNSLNRELNLTWQTKLADNNKILEGSWPPTLRADGTPELSIERKLAADLGIQLGDSIQFDISGQPISGEVSSIREVDWASFQPNFYVIFPEGVLDNQPTSYISSFYAGEKASVVADQILSSFPTITLIDIRQLIQQVRQLLDNLLNATTLIMTLTLSAGLLLLYITQAQEADQRRYENALLVTLGATDKQCQRLNQLEAALLGLISGAIAILSSELLLMPLHQKLLQISAAPHPMLWWLLPLSSAALFYLLNLLTQNRISVAKNLQILRERG